MLIFAFVCGIFYFCLLLFLVGRVIYNFRTKQAQLPAMSKMRRAFYEVCHPSFFLNQENILSSLNLKRE
jgi:hypothetical protein